MIKELSQKAKDELAELMKTAHESMQEMYKNSKEFKEGKSFEVWQQNTALEVILIKMAQQQADIEQLTEKLNSVGENSNMIIDILRETGLVQVVSDSDTQVHVTVARRFN